MKGACAVTHPLFKIADCQGTTRSRPRLNDSNTRTRHRARRELPTHDFITQVSYIGSRANTDTRTRTLGRYPDTATFDAVFTTLY